MLEAIESLPGQLVYQYFNLLNGGHRNSDTSAS